VRGGGGQGRGVEREGGAGLGFRVWGLGFRVEGLGFRVWGHTSDGEHLVPLSIDFRGKRWSRGGHAVLVSPLTYGWCSETF